MLRILFLTLCTIVSLTVNAADYDSYYDSLPISLQKPTAPVIPAYTISILNYGAKADGVTDNTEAFAKPSTT